MKATRREWRNEPKKSSSSQHRMCCRPVEVVQRLKNQFGAFWYENYWCWGVRVVEQRKVQLHLNVCRSNVIWMFVVIVNWNVYDGYSEIVVVRMLTKLCKGSQKCGSKLGDFFRLTKNDLTSRSPHSPFLWNFVTFRVVKKILLPLLPNLLHLTSRQYYVVYIHL